MFNVISFISQKGGVGKSTLARALAVECARSGLSVRIADLDVQQGTIVDWNKIRSENKLEPSFPVESFTNAQFAFANTNNNDFLIIDSPARTSQGTVLLAKNSDIVIQPAGPSRDDLVPALREFNSLVKSGVPKSKLAFALNHISNSNEEIAAREFIIASGYFVLPGYLPERPSYRQAHNEGKSITEVPYKSLKDKADKLLQSIIDKLTNDSN